MIREITMDKVTMADICGENLSDTPVRVVGWMNYVVVYMRQLKLNNKYYLSFDDSSFLKINFHLINTF